MTRAMCHRHMYQYTIVSIVKEETRGLLEALAGCLRSAAADVKNLLTHSCYRMYRLATMHSVPDRRTDGRTDGQTTLSCHDILRAVARTG